jgi:hypothetical protein
MSVREASGMRRGHLKGRSPGSPLPRWQSAASILLHLQILEGVGRRQAARLGLAGPGRERGINTADRVTHAPQFSSIERR